MTRTNRSARDAGEARRAGGKTASKGNAVAIVPTAIRRNQSAEPEPILAAAKDYIDAGWKLIPVGKDKKPLGGKGVLHATDDPAVVARWLRKWPAMGIGGTPPEGTAVVDVDAYKDPKKLNPVVAELRELDGPVQRTQRGGYHFLVSGRVPAARELRKLHDTQYIDTREHDKGYIVLEPSPGYKWRRDLSAAVPRLPKAWQAGGSSAPSQAGGVSIPTVWTSEEARKVAAALKRLDVEATPYDDWIRIGQALHSAQPDVGGPAFAAWDAWSAQDKTKDADDNDRYKGTDDLEKHWCTFGRQRGVTLATLYQMANDADPRWRKDLGKTRAPAAGQDDRAIPSRPLSDFRSAAVPWLLREVVATGQLTILVGNGGVGKSVFAARVVHTLTNGGHWPAVGFGNEGQKIEPAGAVALLVSEEDVESGLVPRYTAQGTDTTLIELIGRAPDGEEPYWVRFDKDLAKIAALIKEYPAQHEGRRICALVVDPITGHLGDTDQNDEASLRDTLQRLVAMARDTGVAILGLIHPNKKIDLDVVNRIMGGKAFSTVSRHVLAIERDPDDPLARYCVVTKSNIGTERLAFVTRGERTPHPVDPHQDVWTCSIDPEVELGVDVDALARQARRRADEASESTESISGWILRALADAGKRGLGLAAVGAYAAQRWREDNPDQELPATFDGMVRNAMSRLCRRKRVMRAVQDQVKGGAPQKQLYFHAEHYDAALADVLV